MRLVVMCLQIASIQKLQWYIQYRVAPSVCNQDSHLVFATWFACIH